MKYSIQFTTVASALLAFAVPPALFAADNARTESAAVVPTMPEDSPMSRRATFFLPVTTRPTGQVLHPNGEIING